jgi:propanol-preferring alcohol dehydrogenase
MFPIPSLGRAKCASASTAARSAAQTPRARLPIIPGHQIVGRVDKLGAGSSRFHIGQRVGVAWLRHTCGECGFCRSDRENLCDGQRFTGYHEHGGYAELAVVPEDFAYEISEKFSSAHAAPLLCAGIIGYRALERSRLRPGGSLAIYGFGSSAHVVIQLAIHRGCDVFVVTRGEKHRRLALEMGARWAGEDASQLPEKVESAILFAPAGELVPAALGGLEKGGTLAVAGIHMSDIPSLNYQDSIFFERDLRSVTANTREDGRNLLREAAAIPFQPRVTEYRLEDANRALHDLKHDGISGTGLLTVGS